MRLSVEVDLRYSVVDLTDVLLQIEPVSDDHQTCVDTSLVFKGNPASHVIAGDDGIGRRCWLTLDTVLDCQYRATFDVARSVPALRALAAAPLHTLPAEVVPYLMPSRFCHSEQFDEFVTTQFGHLEGGTLVAEMAKWINTTFTYDSDASPLGATATDSFHAQAGVCRDYAHVLITFARAAGLPARFVSVYAPSVTPQDFHAVVEVWLDGAWHILDPTGMANPSEMIRIGVGRDAADVAFLTSYGPMTFESQSVNVAVVQR